MNLACWVVRRSRQEVNAPFLHSLHPAPLAPPKATSCYKEGAAGKKIPDEEQEKGLTTESSEHSFPSRTYVVFDPSCMTMLINIPFHPGLESRGRPSPSPRGQGGQRALVWGTKFCQGVWDLWGAGSGKEDEIALCKRKKNIIKK